MKTAIGGLLAALVTCALTACTVPVDPAPEDVGETEHHVSYCHDGNPCTADTFIRNIVGEQCFHDPQPDGTPCGGSGRCMAGECVAVPCAVDTDCYMPDVCEVVACIGGSCSYSAAPNDTPCQGGHCWSGACQAKTCACASDYGSCSLRPCLAFQCPDPEPAPVGLACDSESGHGICDAAGACVACRQ